MNKQENEKMNGLQVLGGFAAIVISVVYSALIGGWALSVLWAWFVVPVFALPVLSVLQAYGLILVARLIQIKPDSVEKEESFGMKIGKGMAKATGTALIFVGVGYIVKAFV